MYSFSVSLIHSSAYLDRAISQKPSQLVQLKPGSQPTSFELLPKANHQNKHSTGWRVAFGSSAHTHIRSRKKTTQPVTCIYFMGSAQTKIASQNCCSECSRSTGERFLCCCCDAMGQSRQMHCLHEISERKWENMCTWDPGLAAFLVSTTDILDHSCKFKADSAQCTRVRGARCVEFTEEYTDFHRQLALY